MRASQAPHILIVQVTPTTSEGTPKSTREIAARLDQIRFNATLNSELEALKYGKMVGAGERLRRLRVNRISAQDELASLADESAANIGWDFLERLNQGGRAAAELWLKRGLPPNARREGLQPP